jgi:pilus assembly protein FimV
MAPTERTQPMPPAMAAFEEEPQTVPTGMRTVAIPKPPAPPEPPPAPEAPPKSSDSELGVLDFDLGDLNLDAKPAAPAPAPTPAPAADATLDFGDFRIDGSEAEVPPPAAADDSDPIARKLELAEEFRQIGDMEGARDLLEEVIAKSEGALKTKAQGMLHSLG